MPELPPEDAASPGARGSLDLAGWLEARVDSRDYRWLEEGWESLLRGLIAELGATHVVELGAGRSPMLPDGLPAGVRYTISDISREELARAPDRFERLELDVCRPARPLDDLAADLVFSKWLLEHLPDPEAAYVNMLAMLRPGGVVVNLHPVLWNVPYGMNKLLPERISERLLLRIDSTRTDEGEPKFPALYRHCRVAPSTEAMIRRAGFSYVRLVPFYGHPYYNRMPVVREGERALRAVLKRFNVRLFATLCVVVARRSA